jgi:TrmH family RNA methyltransferase
MRLGPPITSRANARVKELRASLSGKAHKPGDLLGLEGEHLIHEAHLAGYNFETMYLREGTSLPNKLASIRAENWAVLSSDVFDSAVTTQSPQGIAATWTITELAPRTTQSSNALVLEQLQDPGNLGTLIRSAEAFGVHRIMVTPGTVNQWNPKVVRAGAGSVLRTPVLRAPLEEIVAQLKAEGIRIFAAVPHFTDAHDLAAPPGVLTGRISNSQAPKENRYNYPFGSEGYAASLSYDTDFLQPCAILIGNEGAGLSEKALSLADEQVNIPGGGSESLNAAVAGSILMYESMRQLTLRFWAHKQGLRP